MGGLGNPPLSYGRAGKPAPLLWAGWETRPSPMGGLGNPPLSYTSDSSSSRSSVVNDS
jgi:hypothetical protein